MRIERNDHIIRATLSPEDCLEYNISADDLKRNDNETKDKIHNICNHILETLSDENLKKGAFSVKVGAVGENIIVEMCPSLAPSLFDLIRNIMETAPEPEEEKEDIPQDNDNVSSSRRLIPFKNMNDAIDFCKVAKGIAFLSNNFIKYEEKYYIDISFDENKASSVDMFLSEFIVDKIEETNSRLTYITEHAEYIIKDNAISILAKI